jgi:hypothetical protein
MRTKISVWLALAGACGSFFLGLFALPLSHEVSKSLFRGEYYQDVAHQQVGFQQFVDTWNKYVVKQDGFIPVDPYRGLIESGTFETYDELRGIVFNRCLPPRINPVLARNPKRAVFWQDREDLSEVWTAYADGSWARIPYGRSASNDDDWCGLRAATGYPSWHTLSEKSEWVRTNKGRLVWDEMRRMYVAPATTSTTSTGR